MSTPAMKFDREAKTESAAGHLADFTAGLGPELLEGAIWRKVEVCILDLLAACFTGRATGQVRRAGAWVEALGARAEATLFGQAGRTAAAEAAFANGVAGHSLIREDMHVESGSHIGVVVLPAALAMAERVGAGGADVGCAVAAGYEVMARVGRALMRPGFVQFFRPTGIAGPLGAAAATARVMGLDAEQTTNAISFAANFACGLNEWPRSGGEEIYFHAGMAARNGVLAAVLAAEGGCASETILDGPSAMLGAFGADGDAAHALVADLDRPREILAAFHKPAPACNYVQTPAQAALALVRHAGVAGRDIAAVTVRTFTAAIDYPGCNRQGPFQTVIQAKMSLQFGRRGRARTWTPRRRRVRKARRSRGTSPGRADGAGRRPCVRSSLSRPARGRNRCQVARRTVDQRAARRPEAAEDRRGPATVSPRGRGRFSRPIRPTRSRMGLPACETSPTFGR